MQIVYVDNNFDTSCLYFKLKLRYSNPIKQMILPISIIYNDIDRLHVGKYKNQYYYT